MTRGSTPTRGSSPSRGSTAARAARAFSGTTLVISNVASSSLTTTSVVISWDLSAVGTGQTEYGTTTGYGSFSAPETSFDYSSHAQSLTGLTPGTTYHYRVRSTSVDGIETISSDGTFTTSSSALTFPTTRNPAPKGPSSSPWTAPGVGGSITEADFDGARVTQISDVDTLSMNYVALRGWAVDDEYFVLVGNTKRIYDGEYPHALVRSFSFGVGVNAAWLSGQDPDIIYACHQNGNWLRRYHIGADSVEIRRTFTSYQYVWGGDSSVVSDDDEVLLKAQKANGEWWLISYDIVNDTILAEVKFNHPASGTNLQPKNVHTARSGDLGIVTYGAGMGYASTLYGIYIVDMSTLAVTLTVSAGSAEHFAPGLINTSGNDCLVQFPGYMVDITTGTRTDLFPYASNKNDLAVQHVNAGGQAGWATFSNGLSDRTATNVYGWDCAYSVKLDGSGDVRVWTRIHGVATTANYVGDTTDPYSSLSRNGNKIAFKSRLKTPTTSGTTGHIYIAERV